MVLMVTFPEALATRRCARSHSDGEGAPADGAPWRGLLGPPPCPAERALSAPGREGAGIPTDAALGPRVPVSYADGLSDRGGCFCWSEGSVSPEGCRWEGHSSAPGTGQEGCRGRGQGSSSESSPLLTACMHSFYPPSLKKKKKT